MNTIQFCLAVFLCGLSFEFASTSSIARLRSIVEVEEVKMSSSMKQYVVDCATLAYIRYNSTSDIARYIKNEFNNRYGRYWQCIVGEQFNSSITHKRNHYIFFKLDQYYVVLFKSP